MPSQDTTLVTRLRSPFNAKSAIKFAIDSPGGWYSIALGSVYMTRGVIRPTRSAAS
jgi:hypothetical protein